MAYKRNLNLFWETCLCTLMTTPLLSSMDRVRVNAPRCHTCQYISSDTELWHPNYSFSVCGYFTCQSSNLVYCISCNRILPFFTLVKPSGASGVILANTYIVSTTTFLGSLWPNISTPRVTIFQISGCGVCSHAMGQTSSTTSVEWEWFTLFSITQKS